MNLFAQAASGLTIGEFVAIATAIVVTLSGALAVQWRVSQAHAERTQKAQEARDAANVKLVLAIREEAERERALHRAAEVAAHERYERLVEARALDAAAWRVGVCGVFEQAARAVDTAHKAVELVAGTTPTPDAATPNRDSRPSLNPGDAPAATRRPSRVSRA